MFRGELKTEKYLLKDGVQWYKVLFAFRYNSVKVPSGFITDFASTPEWIHKMFHPTSKYYSKSSVIHDYLYETKLYTRAGADDIFFEAMTEEADENNPRTAFLIRWTFYLAVRLFGKKYWDAINVK